MYFCLAQSDEKARKDMYKLRLTWKMYFPAEILRSLDVRTKEVDPNWPILKAPTSKVSATVASKTPACTASSAPASVSTVVATAAVSTAQSNVPTTTAPAQETASPAQATIHLNPRFWGQVSCQCLC